MSTALEALIGADPVGAARLARQLNKHVRHPHEFQLPILAATQSHRFVLVCAGRRFGKTVIGAKRGIQTARKGGRVVWWIANTYKNVVRGYREVLRQIPPGVLTKSPPPASVAASGRLVLNFPGNTRFEFYSAENPDAMAGEGVDYVIADEAALWKESVWDQIVRPTLMDHQGGGLLISTPRGKNWFWRLWQRGADPLDDTYQSFRFPTSANPYIPKEEIAEMERSLPRIIFEQEVLAEFVSNAATIFRAAGGSYVPLFEPAGQHVFMGCDLAKSYDFTVLSASREDRLPVFHDRFNDLSWPIQKDRIETAVMNLEKAGADGVTVMVDSTGLGDVVFDDLEERGMDVVPIKFDGQNSWKSRAVKLLAADIERSQAFLFDNPILRAEFEAYTMQITDAGRIKYSAPDGAHDDEVSAKLLEHWGQVHEGPPTIRTLDAAPAATTKRLPVRSSEHPAAEDVIEGTYEEIAAPTAAELMANPAVWTGGGF